MKGRLLRWIFLLIFCCAVAGCGDGGGSSSAPPEEPSESALPVELLESLTAEALQAGARFGVSAAVDNGRVVIGAPLEDEGGIADRGAAYVFARTLEGDWELEARLTAADGAVGDRFGTAVALAGDDVLIGAPYRDEAGISEQGAAYLFRRTAADTWEEVAFLLASDGAVGDRFGTAVALVADDLLIGAPYRDEAGISEQGAAYLFRRTDTATDTWEEVAFLLASDGAVGDCFGTAVALAADDVLIGAPYRDEAGISEQGAAYLFRRTDTATDTWEEVALLLATDGMVGDRFGMAVALAGDDALIGAPYRDEDGVSEQGGGYLFSRTDPATDTWEGVALLLATDGEVGALFGSAVSLGGSDGFVLAPAADNLVSADSGAAYPLPPP